MARGKHWIYTVAIRYKCGHYTNRRVTAASDRTAIRRAVQRHIDKDLELSSIYIAEKFPKAKKDRQAYLKAKQKAKAEELKATKERFIVYTGEDKKTFDK